MTYDTYFVVGLIILVLSLPAIVGAFRRGDAPRVPAIMLLIGGGLIAIALGGKPNGYSIETIPQVIDTVVTRWMAYFQA
ncbi:hypothetical protein [Aliiroseovarius sp. F20344]|uniref:hypothetical protein n=1 Tax=Aliiroseovarius sp. F20344 TaxID=2926414 RepID=UPI001FF4B1B0|nr:hypothetical protein [Aliiroseovarius sp. F20344]MCK0144004.1 hypothetical protein [Aliiroseovarius sp. F20344]